MAEAAFGIFDHIEQFAQSAAAGDMKASARVARA
jgi:hypothetical protein